MQKIFLERFERVMGKVYNPTYYRRWGFQKKPEVNEILRDCGNSRMLLLRFNERDVSDLVRGACVVEKIAKPERKKFVESFKRLRDFYDEDEQKACSGCKISSSCELKNKIPNSDLSADLSDIFNMLTAYAHLGVIIQSEYQKYDFDDFQDFIDKFENSEKSEKAEIEDYLLNLKKTGLKFKYCINVLNGFENIIEENYDDRGALIQFKNAVIDHHNHVVQDNEKKDEETRLVKEEEEKKERPSGLELAFDDGKLVEHDGYDYSKPIFLNTKKGRKEGRSTGERVHKAQTLAKNRIGSTFMKKVK